MNYKTVQLAFDSGIATLTLNRPDKRNAISYELIDDLIRALDEVRNSSTGILILTGAGKAFCSGMDLDNLKGLIGRTPEQNLADSRTMVSLFRSLYEFPKPTIAAVNGAAIAGGTGLALLCGLHACRAGSQVWLYRGPDRIRARHRLDVSSAPSRRKNRVATSC